jgi:hypothetical protein
MKTMVVVQRASGRTVTINAKDFNGDLYVLPGETVPEAAPVEQVETPVEEQPRRRGRRREE